MSVLSTHGLVFTMICTASCDTAHWQMWAFPNLVKSIEFSTGGLLTFSNKLPPKILLQWYAHSPHTALSRAPFQMHVIRLREGCHWQIASYLLCPFIASHCTVIQNALSTECVWNKHFFSTVCDFSDKKTSPIKRRKQLCNISFTTQSTWS